MSDVKPSRHGKVLLSFVLYCHAHPDERFWQALRNWSNQGFIGVAPSQDLPMIDTYYWEGRDG